MHWDFGAGSTSEELHPAHTYAAAEVLPQERVFIYLNPSGGALTVDASQRPDRLQVIQILDLRGRVFAQNRLVAGNFRQGRLPEVARGPYVIRLQFENTLFYGKIIRQ